MINLGITISGTYETVWSGDPALDSEAEGFERKLEQARDGAIKWGELCKPDHQPSVFVMRNLPGHVFRRMVRDLDGSSMAAQSDAAIIFRWAIDSIRDTSNHTYPGVADKDTGWTVADPKVVDMLDAYDRRIVNELGWLAYTRSVTPPKS